MHSTYSLTALALASLTAAQTTHMVQVGPGLKYSPNTLMNVKEGDTVNVMFNNVEHNIVSGDFDNPCQYDDDDGGLYSGVLMEKTFSFKVNSTDPAVYYCSVGMHCQAGMALVINPDDDNTYDSYSMKAKGTKSQTPDMMGPFGGQVLNAGGAASGSMSSGSMMMTSGGMMMSSTGMASMSTGMASGSMSMGSMTTGGAMGGSGSGSGSGSSASASSSMGGGGGNAASGFAVTGLTLAGAFAAGILAFAM